MLAGTPVGNSPILQGKGELRIGVHEAVQCGSQTLLEILYFVVLIYSFRIHPDSQFAMEAEDEQCCPVRSTPGPCAQVRRCRYSGFPGGQWRR